MTQPTDEELAEFGKYALFTEPIITPLGDGTWRAQDPGKDWDVSAATREEAVQRLNEEGFRRQREDGLLVWRRHMANPIPGVYALDNDLFLHLRLNGTRDQLTEAFRESERRRARGETYTKADYLRERQGGDASPLLLSLASASCGGKPPEDQWWVLLNGLAAKQQELHDLNADFGVYPAESGATDEQLDNLENDLGRQLDPQHREILKRMNGRRDFAGGETLLSVDEIAGRGHPGQAVGLPNYTYTLSNYFADAELTAAKVGVENLDTLVPVIQSPDQPYFVAVDTSRARAGQSGHVFVFDGGNSPQEFESLRAYLEATTRSLGDWISSLRSER